MQPYLYNIQVKATVTMQPYLYNIQVKTYSHNATLLVQHTGKNLQPQCNPTCTTYR